MALPLPVFKVRCHTCSHFRSPQECEYLPGGVIRCWHCWENHNEALRLLAGHPPRGCQVCGVTFRQLRERAGGGNSNLSMFIHWKDGIYQVLCRRCSDWYEGQRLDLYGDTVHGWLKKLKGAK